jgi:chromate transporter
MAALFAGFLSIAVVSFGGALPWARRMLVERRRWLGAEEFTDLLALCQFLPGGNVINLSVAVGARFRGVPGAIAALLGLMAVPMAIVIGFGALYARYGGEPAVARGLRGLAAAASGLVLATALKIAAPQRRRPRGLIVAALTLVAIAGLRLPLVPSMLVLAPFSIWLHRNSIGGA